MYIFRYNSNYVEEKWNLRYYDKYIMNNYITHTSIKIVFYIKSLLYEKGKRMGMCVIIKIFPKSKSKLILGIYCFHIGV